MHFATAHNDYAQLLAEGGLLVGLPILVTVLLSIGEIGRRFREDADDIMTYWLGVGAVSQRSVDPRAAWFFIAVVLFLVVVGPSAPPHVERQPAHRNPHRRLVRGAGGQVGPPRVKLFGQTRGV